MRTAMFVEKAKRRIIFSGDWVTAAELVELPAETVNELRPDVYSLLRERRIFTISYGGVDYFPTFAFDAYSGYHPVPGLKDVIEVLATRKDAWGMAFWFGSSNSYLGGRQPKALIRTDLGIVLDAARDEVYGILHG